jgi:cell division protein FtsI (penicillin-binding protein 3)
VAQQVLEYLGVPHDMPLKTPKEMQALAKADVHEAAPSDDGADLSAMFEQINSLPADDPLRQPANSAAMAANTAADRATDEAARSAEAANRAPTGAMRLLPAKVLAAFHANGNTTSVMPDSVMDARPLEAPKILPAVQTRGDRAVVIDPAKRVAVPVFVGDGLRAVVQHANAAGLSVQPLGSGLAREQVPAAGTMVPIGTEIVVRFTR